MMPTFYIISIHVVFPSRIVSQKVVVYFRFASLVCHHFFWIITDLYIIKIVIFKNIFDPWWRYNFWNNFYFIFQSFIFGDCSFFLLLLNSTRLFRKSSCLRAIATASITHLINLNENKYLSKLIKVDSLDIL